MVELGVKRASIFSRSGFPIKIQKSTISCSNTTTFRHDSGCGDRSSYLIRGIFSEKNSKESFSKIEVYNFVLEHHSFRTDSGCGDDSIRSYSKHYFREKLKSQFQKFSESYYFPEQARQRGGVTPQGSVYVTPYGIIRKSGNLCQKNGFLILNNFIMLV